MNKGNQLVQFKDVPINGVFKPHDEHWKKLDEEVAIPEGYECSNHIEATEWVVLVFE